MEIEAFVSDIFELPRKEAWNEIDPKEENVYLEAFRGQVTDWAGW